MDTEPGLSPDPGPEQPQERPNWIDWLFRGPSRIAAVLRVLVYLPVVVALVFLLQPFVRALSRPRLSALAPMNFFLQEASLAIAVLLAALVMSLLEKKKPGEYGLPLHGAFRKLFWQGVLVGLVEVSALIGLIAWRGGYSFGSLAVHHVQLVRWLFFWAIFFLLVGFFEEFLFRGYTQFTLGQGIGFWPSAVVLSAIFGLVHLSNLGEGIVGALSVVMIGLILSLSLRRTGTLWFAVGLHASFDWGETFLFSVPNSGFVASGHLSNASLHGPAWLTGGTVGPEGSVFSFLTMAVLCYAIHRFYPAKKAAAASQ